MSDLFVSDGNETSSSHSARRLQSGFLCRAPAGGTGSGGRFARQHDGAAEGGSPTQPRPGQRLDRRHGTGAAATGAGEVAGRGCAGVQGGGCDLGGGAGGCGVGHGAGGCGVGHGASQQAPLVGGRQQLHGTVLHTEGLALDGTRGAGGLTERQLGFGAPDEPVRGDGGRGVRGVRGRGVLAARPAQSLQLVGEPAGFLTHLLQLVAAQRTPAPHGDGGKALLVADGTHKHLVFIFIGAAES